MCGQLKVHMYGTRRAADGWHCEYSETLEEMGFQRGVSSACIFWHKERQLISDVHGDDFTTGGPKRELDRFREELKKRYELKESARLGPANGDDKEGRVLNRIVRWPQEGLTYEAGPGQHEKLVSELGFGEGVRPVSTPVIKMTEAQVREDVPLPEHKVSHFRALAARANHSISQQIDPTASTQPRRSVVGWTSPQS